MNDEFKEARDKSKEFINDSAGVLEKIAYIEGADWAYEWCNKYTLQGSFDFKIAELEEKLAKSEEREKELVKTLHSVIDNGVPGAMYEGSHEFHLRNKLLNTEEKLKIAVKALEIYAEQTHPVHHGLDFNTGYANRALNTIKRKDK